MNTHADTHADNYADNKAALTSASDGKGFGMKQALQLIRMFTLPQSARRAALVVFGLWLLSSVVLLGLALYSNAKGSRYIYERMGLVSNALLAIPIASVFFYTLRSALMAQVGALVPQWKRRHILACTAYMAGIVGCVLAITFVINTLGNYPWYPLQVVTLALCGMAVSALWAQCLPRHIGLYLMVYFAWTLTFIVGMFYFISAVRLSVVAKNPVNVWFSATLSLLLIVILVWLWARQYKMKFNLRLSHIKIENLFNQYKTFALVSGAKAVLFWGLLLFYYLQLVFNIDQYFYSAWGVLNVLIFAGSLAILPSSQTQVNASGVRLLLLPQGWQRENLAHHFYSTLMVKSLLIICLNLIVLLLLDYWLLQYNNYWKLAEKLFCFLCAVIFFNATYLQLLYKPNKIRKFRIKIIIYIFTYVSIFMYLYLNKTISSYLQSLTITPIENLVIYISLAAIGLYWGTRNTDKTRQIDFHLAAQNPYKS